MKTMARYTMTILDIMSMYVWQDGKDKEITSNKEIKEYGRKKLFDFDYELYDNSLKDEFEKSFINHFYMREIGVDTVALFKMRLEDYLNLSKDKWTLLYKTFDDTINPFVNYDVKTERAIDEKETKDNALKRKDSTDKTAKEDLTSNQIDETKQHSDTSSKADSFNRDIFTETPDDRLSITTDEGKGVIEYASNITETTNKNSASEQNDTTGNQKSDVSRVTNDTAKVDYNKEETNANDRKMSQGLTERKFGKIGEKSYIEMYGEFVSVYESINQKMFKEMSYLFMSLLN